MSTILRADGETFDVDAFIAGTDWRVDRVYRRGEPRLPSKPGRGTSERSGLSVLVSAAGLDHFPAQLRDAAAFLAAHAGEIRRLIAFPGVAGVSLDFAVAWRDVTAQSDGFPPEVVRLAGACEIGLELSHYHVTDPPPAASQSDGPGQGAA